jgi:putative protein-disulfide isomerase
MCSWCWGFKPVYSRLEEILQDKLTIQPLLGGLAEDTQEPMSDEIKAYLFKTWQTIQQRIPGCEFNYDFWEQPDLIRRTYPACRAVIAARQQQQSYSDDMITAIQEAYYLQASNPAHDVVLIALADEIGLDVKRFTNALNSKKTQQLLLKEIHHSRQMSVSSFPSLVLEIDNCQWKIPVNYLDATAMLTCINEIIESENGVV